MKDASVDKFTSDFGIRVRQVLNKPLRSVIKLTLKRKLIIESYPKLPQNKPYVFASTHSVDEDVVASISCIDRNTYFLLGSTDQWRYNPQMYAAWVNGVIYVDRENTVSRHNSVKKMIRVIKSGSSILIFPEGSWNNSENLLCNQLFAGPYLIAQETGAEIVPICPFRDDESNTIFFNASNPIKTEGRSKEEVLSELRDSLASLLYFSIEKHTKTLHRASLDNNLHKNYMISRCKEFQRVKWKNPSWEEELTLYKSKNYITEDDVYKDFYKISVTHKNFNIILPILKQLQENQEQDFLAFMNRNWKNKF